MEQRSRRAWCRLVALVCVAVACGNEREAPEAAAQAPSVEVAEPPASPTASAVSATDPGAIIASARAPAGAVLVRQGNPGREAEQWVAEQDAIALGYTIVDLSDSWTPYLFEEHPGGGEQPLPNRYRRILLGLANDQLDGDGQPLEPGERNYLELYGISPSLSVLRQRFVEDASERCSDPEGKTALEAVEQVPVQSPRAMQNEAARQKKAEAELERERERAGLPTLDELGAAKPRLTAKVKAYQQWLARGRALAAAERRLACEGFLTTGEANDKQPPALRHAPGIYDEALRLAIRGFQQKHMIYEGHYLRPKTLAALARPSIENDYESLKRVLRERVVEAAAIVEDGSTATAKGPVTYQSSSGETIPLRNLTEEYAQALLAQLGLDSPSHALAFFERHDAESLKTLHAGVKLAPLPEYYSAHMDLSIVVDRGDVWYDPPFDENDKWLAQPRARLPKLTLFLDYLGQRIPLVSWRTTIGGWRSEQAANGYEYYRYKGSDVGPRVLRKIVSGPVWVAPESTPIRDLVKFRKIQGRYQGVVNYDELGPGYTSAYGVVAGYFVIPGENGEPDADLGIRAHGSSNYLSIYNASGYSHGCHRLLNHLAVRLYDFLIKHRHTKVIGDEPANISRQFLSGDQVYDIRIPSRGYVYELDPPLPVEVLAGRIRGSLRQPVTGYVEKPGVRYPPPEEADAGVTPDEAETLAPTDSAAARGAAAAKAAAAAAAAGARARAAAERDSRGAN